MVTSVPQVLVTCLFIGAAAGFVMHRSDYCIAGMFRDVFLFRNAFMLRTLLLLAVCSMVLFEGARRLGMLPFYPFPLIGSPSAVNVVGGAVFGVGMVLSGGCVAGSLYKMGAGSVPSLLAVAGLVAGSGLYAEIHPGWASLAKKGSFLEGKITLAQATGTDPVVLVALVAVPSLVLLLRWGREGKLQRPSRARGYLQPWLAAVLLAVLGLLSWMTVGMPLGITTAYAKAAATIESFFSAGHVAGLGYFATMPLNLTHPVTGGMIRGGPGPVFDAIAAIQIPLILGIVLGSGLSAATVGELGIGRSAPFRQLLLALGGGVLMGLASRMAPACNVWHLLGGLPILALQSLLFLAGLLPGAWLGGRIVVKVL